MRRLRLLVPLVLSVAAFALPASAAAAELHPTSTKVVCSATVGLENWIGAKCDATVLDLSATPTPPTGPIFVSTQGGPFEPCQTPTTPVEEPGQVGITCWTSRLVEMGKTFGVSAYYGGDPDHSPSGDHVEVAFPFRFDDPPPPIAPHPPVIYGNPSAKPTRPDTKIKAAPARSGENRIARFRFGGARAGGSYECKLDQRAYSSCSSPFVATVAPGRHVFRVRAVNPTGLRDRTPSLYRWFVVR